MTKVLVLCSQCPYPPTDGAKLRLYNTAKILSQRYTIDLLVINSEADEDALSHLQSEFNRVIPFSHSKAKLYRNIAEGVVSRQPIRTNYYSFADVTQWLDKHQDEYDLLYANYLNTTEYVRKRDTPKVVDLVDSMSENYLQRAEPANDENYLKRKLYELEGWQLRRYEQTVLRSFDHSFITTAADARTITGQTLPRNLTVIPNGVRDELLSAPYNKSEDTADDENPQIVFLGRMDYFPNEDAVKYFATNVFPHVRERHPEAEFLIVGGHPSERVQSLESHQNVTVTGFVESLVEYLSEADVVVAPMRFGTGIQNKILEAMALGKAVVTTPLGNEGIDGDDGTHFIVVDSASPFADAVSSLLDDPDDRMRIGKNARDLIHDRYSWSKIGPTLIEAIEKVLADADKRSRV
ncbi:glycosyltransferase [Halorussus sp. AFM4]|uniref:glycosyltransferase n=1 Tax=Halorussus sp. AFM4 TaxID=3421651 RepID=UPI003EBAD141